MGPDTRPLLLQARVAIAFQIAQSPDSVVIRRPMMIPDGFGGMMPDPFGDTVDATIVGRLSHERQGVNPQQQEPAGLDTSLSLFLLWKHSDVVSENEVITARGRLYKVGVVDALKKFNGVIAFQAPLIPAGDIPSGAVTGVSLNGMDPVALNVSDEFQLVATISPVAAVDIAVTWLSSDETVLTVDSSGLVTAVAAGSATVTVTTHEGAFTAVRAFEVSA